MGSYVISFVDALGPYCSEFRASGNACQRRKAVRARVRVLRKYFHDVRAVPGGVVS